MSSITTQGRSAWGRQSVFFFTSLLGWALLCCMALQKKLSAQNYAWARAEGAASGQIYTNDITTDKYGNVYVIGMYNSPSLKIGAYTLVNKGGKDLFIVKYDSLNNVVWAKSFGGSGDEEGTGLSTDTLGNVFAVGHYKSDSLRLGGLVLQNIDSLRATRQYDMFIAHFDEHGNPLWATSMGGYRADEASSVFVDSSGNYYVTGNFNSDTLFYTGGYIIKDTTSNANDILVFKFNAKDAVEWARVMGGSSGENANKILADAVGNVYVHGLSTSPQLIFGGTSVNIQNGEVNPELVLFKYDKDGKELWIRHQAVFYRTNIRGSICLDREGSVYWGGAFKGAINIDTNRYSSNGESDCFLAKYNADGYVVWTKHFGHSGNDQIMAIASDEQDNIYALGLSNSSWLKAGPNLPFLNFSGTMENVFIAKFDASGRAYWAQKAYGEGLFPPSAASLATYKHGQVYLTGSAGVTTSLSLGGILLDNLVFRSSYIAKISSCTAYSTASLALTVCDSLLSPSGRYTWKSSGTYRDTIYNYLGCDSVMTIQLTIKNSVVRTVYDTACQRYLSPSRKFTWDSSGTYRDVFKASNGCDSIVVVHLWIKPVTQSSIVVKACNTMLSPSKRYTWRYSGSYKDTIVNRQGCDSIITVNLTIISSSESVVSVTACDSYTGPSGRHTWHASGIYRDTLVNAVGCDSVVSIDLTLLPGSAHTIEVRSCGAYTSPGGSVRQQSGVYTDTFKNHIGCDSIVTVKLILEAIKTALEVNGKTLSAATEGASYQWLYCDDAYSVIQGAVSRSYTPQKDGRYAVVISLGSCVDTSECYLVSGVKIVEPYLNSDFQVYPNPTTGAFTLVMPEFSGVDALLKITDIAGKELFRSYVKSGINAVNLQNLSSGIYIIHLQVQNAIRSKKILVSK